jgi:hypothetical protein
VVSEFVMVLFRPSPEAKGISKKKKSNYINTKNEKKTQLKIKKNILVSATFDLS